MRPRAMGLVLLVGLPAFPLRAAPAAPAPDPALVERARRLLDAVPLIDGHNDLPWELRQRAGNHLGPFDLAKDQTALPPGEKPPLMTDIPRLRKGGVGAQFWSVYVPVELQGPAATRAVFEQIDVVRRLAERYPNDLELAYSAADVVRIHKAGRIASLIGMEGGHAIDDSLVLLRTFYSAGARYMTITHTKNTDWADSATDEPKHGGLTRFGEQVVREMNRLGMLVDLSHVAPETMKKALAVAEAPAIFSHSSARALADHPRNVPDDVLALLAKNGGVDMVTFVPSFLTEERRAWGAAEDGEEKRLQSLHPEDAGRVKRELEAWKGAHPEPRPGIADVADHVEHVRKVAGIDHVGIGSDFDGITAVPAGLDGVDKFPVLLAELLRRGWSDADVQKLAGGNLLRVLGEVEKTAERLRRERPASEATIEELDGAPKPAASSVH
ncbi:MAG TPA: dipeptidase [Thermoanaerobaculia bacterium]|nr:dipeptidase [Thermoanaerobaculia bacterium]